VPTHIWGLLVAKPKYANLIFTLTWIYSPEIVLGKVVLGN